MNTLFGEISTEDFLANYWQKKSLLIRGAFPDFKMPFSAEELAGIVLDTDAPARIIIEKGLPPENKPWTAKYAPFTEEDFTNLPQSHWSLLVNDLEHYVPELGNLIEPFRFIPDWRIDDLMVSYAADQGSVGPHVDEYDVFLIQGEGKRRWRVITHDNFPKELDEEASLPTLKQFNTDEEWLLEAGDMLYLPPNVPHYGIAEGACFTFSIGFRAPNTLDLTQSWIESFSHNVEKNSSTSQLLEKRFSDADRKLQKNSSEIVAEDIQKLSNQILSLVTNEEEYLPIFLGQFLTESRGDSDDKENNGGYKISDSSDYKRKNWVRIAYIKHPDAIHLFAAGNHLKLPLTDKFAIQEFCKNYYYSAESLQSLLKNNDFRILFEQLLESGNIFPC